MTDKNMRGISFNNPYIVKPKKWYQKLWKLFKKLTK